MSASCLTVGLHDWKLQTVSWWKQLAGFVCQAKANWWTSPRTRRLLLLEGLGRDFHAASGGGEGVAVAQGCCCV